MSAPSVLLQTWTAADFTAFSQFDQLSLVDANKENVDPAGDDCTWFVASKKKTSTRQVPKQGDWQPVVIPVASYNWLSGESGGAEPTIAAPGAPKLFYPWSGGQLTNLLGERGGVQRNETMVVDEDAHRCPRYPLEALLASVRVCRPAYRLDGVDIVGDLCCVKRLARFLLYVLENEAVGRRDLGTTPLPNFEFDVVPLRAGGGPVAFVRRDNCDSATWVGYGAAFCQACTDDTTDSALRGPHKRVSQVTLGGLQLLLRHKVLTAVYPTGACQAEKAAGGAAESVGAVRVRRGGVGACECADFAPVVLASLRTQRRLSPDKWLDMLFTGADRLYLGTHYGGWFSRVQFMSVAAVRQLSGVVNERALLHTLESFLCQLIVWARSVDSAKNAHLSIVGDWTDSASGGRVAALKLYRSQGAAEGGIVSAELLKQFF